eukprot:scaffold101981_cov24-Cyclotella_meneghiniana.AAC.4
MEGFRCCESLGPVQTHTFWCKNWIGASPTLTPPAPQKHVVVTILGPTYQSQPSPTIHHTYDDRLEGVLEAKSSPPTTQKSGCGYGNYGG